MPKSIPHHLSSSSGSSSHNVRLPCPWPHTRSLGSASTRGNRSGPDRSRCPGLFYISHMSSSSPARTTTCTVASNSQTGHSSSSSVLVTPSSATTASSSPPASSNPGVGHASPISRPASFCAECGFQFQLSEKFCPCCGVKRRTIHEFLSPVVSSTPGPGSTVSTPRITPSDASRNLPVLHPEHPNQENLAPTPSPASKRGKRLDWIEIATYDDHEALKSANLELDTKWNKNGEKDQVKGVVLNYVCRIHQDCPAQLKLFFYKWSNLIGHYEYQVHSDIPRVYVRKIPNPVLELITERTRTYNDKPVNIQKELANTFPDVNLSRRQITGLKYRLKQKDLKANPDDRMSSP